MRSVGTDFTEDLDLPTLFSAAADLVVVAHATFVVFVVVGGLLVVRWPRLAWVHLPASAWGVLIEFAGWVCPLTPLEHYLRQRSGGSAYQGEFIEHYVLSLLYPAHLTRGGQICLAAFALIVNMFVYWQVIRMTSREKNDE